MSEENGWMDKETYHPERNLLIDAEREAARGFDKAMITLSAGALALSLTFVKNIAPSPSNHFLLFLAWAAFILSLLVILVSFLCSQAGMRRQRQIIDTDLMRVCRARDQKNCWHKTVIRLNLVSMVSFVVGVILLALFAGLNLPRKESHEQEHIAPAREGRQTVGGEGVFATGGARATCSICRAFSGKRGS